MALSAEKAEKFKYEVAVTCCRKEEGSILGPSDFEDPTIFPDLIDSGLLNIGDNTAKIGEALGAKLLKTIDSLRPITKDILENIQVLEDDDIDLDSKAVFKFNMKQGQVIKASDLENPMHFEKLEDSLLIKFDGNTLTRGQVIGAKLLEDAPALTPVKAEVLEGFDSQAQEGSQILEDSSMVEGGILRIQIEEGKGINIEVPLGSQSHMLQERPEPPEKEKKKLLRSLVKKHYKIDKVDFGPETKIDGKTLYIEEDICHKAVDVSNLVESIKIDIITENEYSKYSETIMDVQPIATKEDGDKLGRGTTRVLDGVVMMVTGTDEDGVQVGEFGSSEGILEENIMWNRPGAPDRGDILIKTEVIIKRNTNMERRGPLAVHKATDFITQEIRNAIKGLQDESLVVDEEVIKQYRRPAKKKVLIVKEIMGQGAMHDNIILPMEPVGILGGKPNVDLGNLPIMLSPLEVLDGGIHALTCIGPASKENSRHYWREPLVIEAINDPQIDLCGVIFVGSPQINSEKFYVSERLGMIIEAHDLDGALVVTEGFGNNHIDFASHIEQIGMRDIPVVGMSFCGQQGALVVGNQHMKHMIDLNKSEDGIENEILSCNTLCTEDAVRGLAMLKSVMQGQDTKEAERKWDPDVKEKNLDLIEKQLDTKVERV